MRAFLLTLLLIGCEPKADPPGCELFVRYRDEDLDGYGDVTTLFETCSPERGVEDATDCDDGEAAIHPDADEDCAGTVDANCDGSVGYADADADGAAACEDCDDTNALRYPGAGEFCNDLDDDCDGEVDDHPIDGTYYYADADADGYGNGDWYVRACEQPTGWTEDLTDCLDTDPEVHLGADEVCDGIDNNCDGIEDDADSVDAPTWYDDNDEDGYGNPLRGSVSCRAPSGYVSAGTDCDDRDAEVNPAATEVCNGDDDDCDSSTDEADATDARTFYDDADQDGHGDPAVTVVACDPPADSSTLDDDCDPADGTVYPGADESCDDVDDDCDGTIDEDPVDAPAWYSDVDGDSYGDPDVYTLTCDAPAGTVAEGTDCDDADPARSPGASETCNSVDDDCDGSTDEGASDATTWFRDADGDTHGSSRVTRAACEEPSGFVAVNTDCDDADAAVSPDATEVCNAVDDDCDGTTDEASAVDAPIWYADADVDGYGDAAVATPACLVPSGYVADGTDCDDADDAWHPHAPEADCGDPNDYNCDGSTGADDADGDLYTACEDCDDADASVSPSGTETCNDVDDNCDGTADEAGATGGTDWYADIDEDGYGDATVVLSRCDEPAGYVALASDCDDADATISPSAMETCATAADDDCDGDDNDRNATGCTRYYWDYDADGYGSTSNACLCVPDGYLTADNDDDCDDAEATVSPAGTEDWGNGLDDDCDDVTDVVYGEDVADLALMGEDPGDSSGESIAVGDFNGDGAPDVFVGATGADGGGSTSGGAYVVFGPMAGEVDLSAADLVLVGVDPSDAVGVVVASADLDGDGKDDFIGTSTAAGSGAGEVYLLGGGVSGIVDLSVSDAILTGVARNDAFGVALEPGGDLDGDGLSDLLVGASGEDSGGSSAGAAYLVSGLTGSGSALGAFADLIGEDASDLAGGAVAVLGDVDGDGQIDVAIGATGDDAGGSGAGSVYVVYGPATGILDLSTADAKLIGEAASDRAGVALAAPGDLDEDGLADVLVGADGAGTGGRAYVVSGLVGTIDLSDASVVFSTGGTLEGFGTSLCAGDVIDDGATDVFIGAPLHTSDVGAAYLFGGPFSGSYDDEDVLGTFLGTTAADIFGVDVLCDDLDGDGVADLLVTGQGDDAGGSAAGAVWGFWGG